MLDEIIARHENWEDLKQGLDDPSLIRMALVTSHVDRAWLLDRLREAERLLRQYKTMCDLNRVPDPAIDAWLDSLHREEADL